MVSDTSMYDYPAQIKSPHQVGIKDRGSWGQVGKNIQGMEQYFKVLGGGDGSASKHVKTNKAGGMGNRYFVEATGKCKNTEEQRYIYMDHIPTSTTSQRSIFGEDVGLIPGLTNNVISSIDPTSIINAVSDTNSDCVKVRVTEVNSAGVQSGGDEDKWVSITEANNIDPCWYKDGVRKYTDPAGNVTTGASCERDGFANIQDNHTIAGNAMAISEPPPTTTHTYAGVDDPPLDSAETIYIALLSGVGLYAAYRLAAVLK
jgi:hypothetical protein